MTVIFIPQETKNEFIAYSGFFFFFSTPETQSRNTYIKVSNKVNKVSNNVKNPGKSLATISAPEKQWRGKQSAL